MFRILIVEDDKELQTLFRTVLEENGYYAVTASNGLEALEIMDCEYVDLIISDIMMPKMDGFQLTKSLRETNNNIPILIITAKDQISDKKQGFLAGTDDYMVKPVDVNEMLWRISALLRRSQSIHEKKLIIGSTILDFDSLTVTSQNDSVALPQKEFLILFKLLSSIGRIFTKKQIIDEIWGIDYYGAEHSLEVHIGRLRERFRSNMDFGITTVRGLGYKAVKK